jgi:hypothetical protein
MMVSASLGTANPQPTTNLVEDPSHVSKLYPFFAPTTASAPCRKPGDEDNAKVSVNNVFIEGRNAGAVGQMHEEGHDTQDRDEFTRSAHVPVPLQARHTQDRSRVPSHTCTRTHTGRLLHKHAHLTSSAGEQSTEKLLEHTHSTLPHPPSSPAHVHESYGGDS